MNPFHLNFLFLLLLCDSVSLCEKPSSYLLAFSLKQLRALTAQGATHRILTGIQTDRVDDNFLAAKILHRQDVSDNPPKIWPRHVHIQKSLPHLLITLL